MKITPAYTYITDLWQQGFIYKEEVQLHLNNLSYNSCRVFFYFVEVQIEVFYRANPYKNQIKRKMKWMVKFVKT